jgi:ribosomal protein S18 acetylase RimI-like enzyme
MSDNTVRRPRPEALATVGELTVQAYQADGYLSHDPDGGGYGSELRDAASRAEQAELLVAVDSGDTVLGSVTVARPGTRYAELCRDGELEFRMLAVAASARRRGVGEVLCRAVVDRAHELGAERVVLCTMEAMTTAHRLYERLGFRRVPERDWVPVPGLTLIAYVLEL